MKRIILFPVFLATLFFSCHKKEKPTPEDNRQYSHWVVNEDSFSTNEVESSEGLGSSALNSDGITNDFSLFFYTGGGLPTQGSFQMSLDCDFANPAYVCFGIAYNGIGYHKTSIPAYLHADEVNGKARYTLQSTWFYNAQDTSDSVRVSGIFNEP